jgi:hypothetical protein
MNILLRAPFLFAILSTVLAATSHADPSLLTAHAGRYETTASTSGTELRVLYPYQSNGLGTLYQWIKGTTTGFTARIDVAAEQVRLLITRTVSSGGHIATDDWAYTFKVADPSRAVYQVTGDRVVLAGRPATIVGSASAEELAISDEVSDPRTYRFPAGDTAVERVIATRLELTYSQGYLNAVVSLPHGSPLLAGEEREGIFTFRAVALPQ